MTHDDIVKGRAGGGISVNAARAMAGLVPPGPPVKHDWQTHVAGGINGSKLVFIAICANCGQVRTASGHYKGANRIDLTGPCKP